MRWVRANLRYGSWCALLAVAIHIAVSFGHAHRIDAFRQIGLLSQGAPVTQGHPTGDPPGAPTTPLGLALDYCAVCVVINMGASMLPAEAPASTGPAIFSQIRFARAPDDAIAPSGRFLFRARGPPVA
jgi:hypothetical protein